jgi:transposase
MPRYRTACPPEFRRQMVDPVRSGGTPEELARAFEPTAQSICTWVKQAERNAGKRTDGSTSADREELARLRRENHRQRQERDILARAAAWFARASKAVSGSRGRTRPWTPFARWPAS